ncbi:MAG TPA: rhodoquinone biosynthesis methyltransferase RquA [Candidatus Competibacter sp.]|nr:methyltransferase [Candidatus Competibacteraceae bacterium]HRE53816.1 rhodoquinone biosynthesis methyltransferase RquA [Candidatus Competibacter sp.]HUM94837.1 rhodoquinone biosynthesis methyltransferase RquA [Candidatus Competibacter sp.]
MSSQPVQGAATLAQPLPLENAAGPEIENPNTAQEVALDDPRQEFDHPPVQVPLYLQETYWWAYVHPAAVRFFERQWLVNLILWGNFNRLRDLALDELGASVRGDILQVACVYGNFTEHLIRRLDPTARLAVVDVAQVQLENLKNKLPDPSRISIHHQDSTDLRFADASHDCVVVFFLLHEQPEAVRAQTVAQALRVVKPGGKVVFVDYHRPSAFNPFRYVMIPILTTLEPFAMDLWRREITDWLPERYRGAKIDKQTYFGGLYQKVVITV